MKHTLLFILALLLAACTGGGSLDSGAPGDFSAAETAPDAVDVAPPKENPERPLTSEEEQDAALKVNKLATATEPGEREAALQALIALGPRYLKYLRSIHDEDIALDMMWVLRRIENDAKGPEAPAPANVEQPEKPKETTGGAGEDRKPPPEYADPAAEFDREQVERFMGSRLNQARRQLAAGDLDGATRIADAALTLLPDSRLKPEFEKVLRDARRESQQQLLISGVMELSPEPLQYASREKGAKFAEQLKISCFLKNVSTHDIRLKLYGGTGKESLLVLDVTYEQLDYTGLASKTMQAQSSVPVNVGADALLKPNETHTVEIPLEALNSLDADAPRHWALGRITIRPALRVYEAADGDGRILVLQAIRFEERTVLVFPAGYDLAGAARNPINTVRQHLKDKLPQEAFMAAQLAKPTQKRAMGDLLLGDDLDTDALANQTARKRAMALLVGTGGTWDAPKWRRWWEQNRTRF